jgi:hypothetical protein
MSLISKINRHHLCDLYHRWTPLPGAGVMTIVSRLLMLWVFHLGQLHFSFFRFSIRRCPLGQLRGRQKLLRQIDRWRLINNRNIHGRKNIFTQRKGKRVGIDKIPAENKLHRFGKTCYKGSRRITHKVFLFGSRPPTNETFHSS